MKYFNFTSIYILAGTLLFFTSCNVDEVQVQDENEHLVFEITSELSNAKTSNNQIPYSLLITIKDEEANEIYSSKNVTIYNFEGKYISEPLVIAKGNYKLTEYKIVNDLSEVIYATPTSTSSLHHLVNQPLDMEIIIQESEVNEVAPQVISTTGYTSQEFGYDSFDYNLFENLQFFVDVKVKNKSGELVSTPSDLIISVAEEENYEHHISAEVNKVSTYGNYENYSLSVSKEGHIIFSTVYTKEELEGFTSESPLEIELINFLDQPLLHLPFSNSLLDISGNNYNGSYSATTPNYVVDYNGISDDAVHLSNSGEYINVPAINDFSTNQITVATWVRPTQFYFSECQLNMIILNKTDNESNHGLWYLAYGDNFADGSNCNNYDPENTPFGFRVDFEDGSIGFEYTTTRINLNQWYFVVGQYDGKYLNIYVNGELETQVEYDKTLKVFSNGLTIGRDTGSDKFPYNMRGDIDDIKLFNRALTQEQILELYHEKVNLK